MAKRKWPEQSSTPNISFSVRETNAEDVEMLASICYKAFKRSHDKLGQPTHSDFSSPEGTAKIYRNILKTPTTAFSCAAVDDCSGHLLGSAFLHHGSDVYSIGPVSVDPDQTGHKGVGKALMKSLIDRGKENGATSIRLTQVAESTNSFALYMNLGFVPCDTFSTFKGLMRPMEAAGASSALGFTLNTDTDVRMMEDSDVNKCAELFKQNLGYDRSHGIRILLGPTAWVAFSKSGDILAYTTGFHLYGHTVAQNEDAFVSLVSGIVLKADPGVTFELHMPTRLHHRLVRWALAAKLSLMRHHWYMVLGSYTPPQDDTVYLPSVLH